MKKYWLFISYLQLILYQKDELQNFFILDLNNYHNLDEYFNLESIQLDFYIFLFYHQYLLIYFLVLDFHLQDLLLQYILGYQKFILYI